MTVLEIEGVTGTAQAVAAPAEKNGAPAAREVRHEYTHTLPSLLSQFGVSLLVSTYQAGKVVAVGVAEGELSLSYHNFERAMGLAVKPDAIAVGARAQVWFLKSAPDLARRVDLGDGPAHDAKRARDDLLGSHAQPVGAAVPQHADLVARRQLSQRARARVGEPDRARRVAASSRGLAPRWRRRCRRSPVAAADRRRSRASGRARAPP